MGLNNHGINGIISVYVHSTDAYKGELFNYEINHTDTLL